MSLESVGMLSAFMSSVTWATGLIVYSRLAFQYTGPQIHFTRALFALPLFFAMTLLDPRGLGIHEFEKVDLLRFAWLTTSVIASFAIGDLFFLNSQKRIGFPAALAIASSYPLWSAIAGFVFLGQALSTQQWIGLIVVVLGVSQVILGGAKTHRQADKEHLAGFGSGVLLAFVASLFWALNAYSVAQGVNGIHPGAANTIRMFMALGLCTLVRVLWYGRGSMIVSLSDLKRPWPVFIFEGFGGATFFTYGLAHAPLAMSSTLSSLAPVISLGMTWYLGLEKLNIQKILGTLGVVLGVALLLIS